MRAVRQSSDSFKKADFQQSYRFQLTPATNFVRIQYTKMHGLGNDFMLIDATARKFTPEAGLIRQWSNRRTGVGFDQLLVIEPCDDVADFAFRAFNADGSETRQCGNGVRCIAHFAWTGKLVNGRSMRTVAGGRVMQMEVLADERVRVDMGAPSFAPEDVPFLCDGPADSYEIAVAGQTVRAGVVSFGNPHVVLRVDDLAAYPVARLGRALQSLPGFPQSVNAGFMQIENSRNLRLRVFERGAGETMACGSGACAAFAVARLWGLIDETAQVKQRGGALDIDWTGPGAALAMAGPAEHVYNGEIEY